MTDAELTHVLRLYTSLYGLQIDKHPGTKAFGDVEIGCGAPYDTLRRCQQAMTAAAGPLIGRSITIRTVNVPGHPQAGKPYIEWASKMWDDTEPSFESTSQVTLSLLAHIMGRLATIADYRSRELMHIADGDQEAADSYRRSWERYRDELPDWARWDK